MSEARTNDIRAELLADLKDDGFRHGYASEFLDMILARQIRALRKERGWTQADLAKRIGTSQPFISEIESEDYGSLSISTLKDLACVFDVYLNVRFESFATLVSQVDTSNVAELQVPAFDRDPSIAAVAARKAPSGHPDSSDILNCGDALVPRGPQTGRMVADKPTKQTRK